MVGKTGATLLVSWLGERLVYFKKMYPYLEQVLCVGIYNIHNVKDNLAFNAKNNNIFKVVTVVFSSCLVATVILLVGFLKID